jgi:hypothetical protein
MKLLADDQAATKFLVCACSARNVMSSVPAGACSGAVTAPVAKDTTLSFWSYSPVLAASSQAGLRLASARRQVTPPSRSDI